MSEEMKKTIERTDTVCQNCDNCNYYAENGCLEKRKGNNENIPESDTVCSKKMIENYKSTKATCPYCGDEKEIYDLYDYGEDDVDEECDNCEKLYNISVSTNYSYNITTTAILKEIDLDE